MKKEYDGYNLNKADLKGLTDGIRAKSHRKEGHYQGGKKVVVYVKGEIKTIIDLRFYAPGWANYYACIWINDSKKERWGSGSGVAGGYGYHKPSAAAEAAIESAGIKLKKNFGGCGDKSIDVALHAIASAMGYRKPFIINSHP